MRAIFWPPQTGPAVSLFELRQLKKKSVLIYAYLPFLRKLRSSII